MVYRPTTAPVFGRRRETDRLPEATFGREGANARTPAVDVQETDKEVRIDVGIPGVRADEVEITVENGVLTIRGDKQTLRKEGDKDGGFRVVERAHGAFVRSFQLPQGLDESGIEADYDNGMLVIHVPKATLPEPRRIPIRSRGVTSPQRNIDGH